MARRSVKVVVAVTYAGGRLTGAIDVQDDKGNSIPLEMGPQTANHLNLELEAEIGDLINLDTFDKTVKANADAEDKRIKATLAAQAEAAANQVPIPDLSQSGGTFVDANGVENTVTPTGKPS